MKQRNGIACHKLKQAIAFCEPCHLIRARFNLRVLQALLAGLAHRERMQTVARNAPCSVSHLRRVIQWVKKGDYKSLIKKGHLHRKHLLAPKSREKIRSLIASGVLENAQDVVKWCKKHRHLTVVIPTVLSWTRRWGVTLRKPREPRDRGTEKRYVMRRPKLTTRGRIKFRQRYKLEARKFKVLAKTKGNQRPNGCLNPVLRLRAVYFALTTRRPLKEIAGSLHTHPAHIRKWVRKYKYSGLNKLCMHPQSFKVRKHARRP